ncbi:ATPase, partial [Planktothricoides sp. FACHB-1370]|nr:ATPase [Planktothricoides raciborskii FACHB-1370]
MDIQEVLNWTDEQVFAKTGKHLESLQKSILEGIWQHQDYYEIAENNDKSYDHVKKEAWKLWKILSDVVGEDVKKSNVFSVLEQAEISENHADCLQIGNINICGEQQRSPSDLSSSNSPAPQNSSPIIDLIDAPEITDFYNRTTELNTLKQWILKDQIRLITIYGLSGIGKSLLTRQLI